MNARRHGPKGLGPYVNPYRAPAVAIEPGPSFWQRHRPKVARWAAGRGRLPPPGLFLVLLVFIGGVISILVVGLGWRVSLLVLAISFAVIALIGGIGALEAWGDRVNRGDS